MNVLVIGDTHFPFVHKKYLDFCLRIRDAYKCDKVVHSGDLVDFGSISYFEKDPDAWSPKDEMSRVDKIITKWHKEIPEMLICRGNHDRLVDRKGKTAGLPSRVFKSFREMWKLPEKWIDDWAFEIDGVKYTHGTGYGGRYPHIQAAYDNRQSTVIGHLHSVCGVEWTGNKKNAVFGMCVGCGINSKSHAFAYGRDHKRQPIISCGVVTDNGRNARPVIMR